MLAANGWYVLPSALLSHFLSDSSNLSTVVRRAPTTYGSSASQLAKDEVAVFIGLAYFIVLYIGYSIYHKRTSTAPHFVPLADVDLLTAAVWGPGGGAVERETAAAEKTALKQEKGTKGYALHRVKEALW